MWEIVLYLFHFISENEIIYILMYFIKTHQLGLEPESARKDKLQTRSPTNYPVRALNKLLKTQAGDISPYFLRELIAITCLEHKCKIFLSLSRHIEKQLGKRSKKTVLFARILKPNKLENRWIISVQKEYRWLLFNSS